MLWSDTDFQRVAVNTKLSERTIEACRDVLVNGMSGKDAGIKHSVLPAQISRALKTIREDSLNLPNLVIAMQNSVEGMKLFAIQEAKAEFPSFSIIEEIEADKTYLGPIVMKTPGFVVQRTGHSLVVHDIGKLQRSPGMGNILEIEYPKGGGLASVNEKSLDRRADDLSR